MNERKKPTSREAVERVGSESDRDRTRTPEPGKTPGKAEGERRSDQDEITES
jgi:hypothetical protein